MGFMGLVNMGNTCYLNSALQCLSHTVALADYFLGGHYKAELNVDNPLGYKGKLVKEFASLVSDMWKPTQGNAYLKPSRFNNTIWSNTEMFEKYQQHDAQEFLAFLLDALHEDLNRVSKKPYVEDIDFIDGEAKFEGEKGPSVKSTDDVVALKAWTHYLMRDRSIIVDMFQGQLKSTLQVCHHHPLVLTSPSYSDI